MQRPAMKEFSIFLSGLASGIVIGLLLKRRHVPNPRKPEDCSSCDIITCSSETGIPRITVKPRALPNRHSA